MAQSLKQSLSDRFREGRDNLLRETLSAVPRSSDRLRILDLGGRTDYWARVGYEFLADLGAQITLQNLHESEIKPDPLAPAGLFDWAVGDACALAYPSGSFDFCHSNSVIEHVGLWSQMEAFARETRRVAPSYYVQTPNYWFPIEPHFWAFPMNHWLPRPMRAGLMRNLKLATAGKAQDVGTAYAYVDSARLLTRGQMRFLFPEGEIKTERFALMTKSLIATHLTPDAVVRKTTSAPREEDHV